MMNLTLRSTVREMRKKAVIETFFETLKNLRKANPFITQEEVVEIAINANAPRFFVTYENARRFISIMIRKKKLPLVNQNKIAMYKELYKRYKKNAQNGPCRYQILEKIIEEQAPSFYLDEETFKGIIYRTLGKKNYCSANS